jgi:PAS domain S-box-containing protein
VPSPLGEELVRTIQEEAGQDLQLQVRRAEGLEELPDTLLPGLVVLGDPGGSLEELVALCRQLHARRSSSRTQLIVLTRRSTIELTALARAGADECLAPPGDGWGVRIIALRRRLHLDGVRTPELDRLEQPRLNPQEALLVLLSSTSADLGYDFFRVLIVQLASAFRVSSAMVGELSADQQSLRTLALWEGGSFQESVSWPLEGTPHQRVLTLGSCHVSEDVQARFPQDANLRRLRAQSYLGVVLRDPHQRPIGVMAVAHQEPLEVGLIDYALLGALGARTGAELARLHMQAELAQTRDFLRKTLNALPEPVFVKDRAHKFVAVNTALCRIVGHSEEALIGKSDFDFFPAHEAELFVQRDEEVFQSGQPNENEEMITDNEGGSRILVTKKAAFTGTRGEPFLVGVIRDITEWRRMEVQLRLADRMASVGTLAAGVAHEINNPLSYIASNQAFIAEQLANEELTAAQRVELRDAVLESLEGAGRIRVIVQDLKTFARADEETQGPVDVHRVVNSALRLVRNEVHHRARISRSLEPVPAVQGNEARLGQILVNLLVNALQAFPPERPAQQNHIRISTRSEGDWVYIEVEDNGQGMTPEVQRRIFDPFFTTKPIGSGTGLGLSISNKLVQIMGGGIEVQSKLAVGSTFRLVLPACGAKGRAGPAAPGAVAAAEEARRRVLIIDDEPSVGSAVRRLLRGIHEVDALQDAREALRLIASGTRYDAIVCDVMMPEMNGVQFLQELERSAPEQARRTGLMSGGVFDAKASEFIRTRQIELLPKPFDRESMQRFVARLCDAPLAGLS